MITTETISRIFSGFNKFNALIIGDVMVDAYLWGTVDRISPEAPVPIVHVKKRENRWTFVVMCSVGAWVVRRG